jgi:hypothetical protein
MLDFARLSAGAWQVFFDFVDSDEMEILVRRGVPRSGVPASERPFPGRGRRLDRIHEKDVAVLG